MKTQHIIPAIIPDSLSHLQSRLRDVHHVVNRVQIDVMNGTYASTSSWPYIGAEQEAFKAIRREDEGLPFWQDFDFEIDLMVKNPEEHLEEWALAGAACIIFHVESTDALEEIAEQCNARRIEFALAIKPSTDIETLAPYTNQALFVQVMGNDRIGHHGVELDESVPEKIRAIKKQWPQLTVGVDIGVNEETLPSLYEAGATRFASGSAVFNFASPAGAISHLESIISKSIEKKDT